jgi:hypothetical protein
VDNVAGIYDSVYIVQQALMEAYGDAAERTSISTADGYVNGVCGVSTTGQNHVHIFSARGLYCGV